MSKEEIYQIAFELLTQDSVTRYKGNDIKRFGEQVKDPTNAVYIEIRYGMTKPQAISIISDALQKAVRFEELKEANFCPNCGYKLGWDEQDE